MNSNAASKQTLGKSLHAARSFFHYLSKICLYKFGFVTSCCCYAHSFTFFLSHSNEQGNEMAAGDGWIEAFMAQGKFCRAIAPHIVVECTGDGNCFFRAVSWAIYGNEDQHAELREQAVKFMVGHRERFEEFLTDASYEDFIKRARDPTVDADEHHIQACSYALNRPIEVYGGEEVEPTHVARPELILMGIDPIRVYYTAEGRDYRGHYDAVLLADEWRAICQQDPSKMVNQQIR